VPLPSQRKTARKHERQDADEIAGGTLTGDAERRLPVLGLKHSQPGRVMEDRALRVRRHKRVPAAVSEWVDLEGSVDERVRPGTLVPGSVSRAGRNADDL
jgi:hypothetical protein